MLRLTALQLPARFGAYDEQLAYAQVLLEGGPRTDLVLLPEASLTGYVSPARDFQLTPFAEPLDGPTREAFAHLARRFDCLFVGPIIEREGERCFNSLLGVAPDGDVRLHYRKHHPWFPETWATAGEGPSQVVTWRGVKVMTAICFDGHFLSDDAGARLDEAELLLFSSAWVDDTDSLPPLLAGLAAKHDVDVLNANWGVGSPRVPGQGGSMFVSRAGVVTRRLGSAPGRLDMA